MNPKFGTEEFFTSYINNQLVKENGGQFTLYRIHFSLTTYVLETFGNKDSFVILKNLNSACEKASKKLAREGGISV